MTSDFAGRTVLITGAAHGLGAATATAFAAHGARLILSDIDEAGLKATAGSLGNADITTKTGNVANPDHARELVQTALDQHGHLDIAINNAGVVHPVARLPDIPPDEVRRIVEIDLLGVVWALQAQLPAMARTFADHGTAGAIVNIASVAGLVGAPTLGAYAAAKHGVVGLTCSAAIEYARRGVRVNAICPAFTRTEMVMRDISGGKAGQDEAVAQLVSGVPMRRLAEPAEIVQAILWAADPANSFMTGQAIAIDGGLSAM